VRLSKGASTGDWRQTMETQVSRQFVEDLLASFLSAAVGLSLDERIEQLERLPPSHRQKLDALPGEVAIWVAWVTPLGVVVATGRYDHERSRQISTHVLLIEWWAPPDVHHVSWWRADANRSNEWTAGRGHTSIAP
jgi:hypothetical protein